MKIIHYLNKNLPFVIGLAMLFTVTIYGAYRNNLFKDEGRITIAKVVNFEGAEQGVNVNIIIYFKGKEYKCTIDSWCLGCVGKYFYVKVIESDPTETPQLYKDKEVPYCILQQTLPFNGWKKIPKDSCRYKLLY